MSEHGLSSKYIAIFSVCLKNYSPYTTFSRSLILFNKSTLVTPLLEPAISKDAFKFLDLIIKDYVDFEATTKRLVTEIKTLESDNAKLKAEIRNLKASLDIAGSNKGVTNVDLLKRISDLEKVVYGE